MRATPRSRRILHGVERGLLALGLVLIASWFRVNAEARAFQWVAARSLEKSLCDTLQGPPAPDSVGREAGPGSRCGVSLGRIDIPRLRVSAMIAEGTDPEVLDRAVGHVSSTPRPGYPGNIGLAGHRDTYFRRLGELGPHDLIRIATPGSTRQYEVAWTGIVDPRRLDVLDSTVTPSLTLVTCYPFHWIGPAPKRFVVRAVRADGSGTPDPLQRAQELEQRRAPRGR